MRVFIVRPFGTKEDIDDQAEAHFKLNELKRRCDQLHHCAAFACEASKPAKGEDPWRVMTIADHAVLHGDAAPRVKNDYKQALAYVPGDFNPEAAARPLILYRKLGLFELQVATGLRALGVQNDLEVIEPRKTKGVVIVGTGHRIDAADRSAPRFPAAREQAVRERLKAEIAAVIEGVDGPKLVVDGGQAWVRRFDSICDRSKPRILSDEDKLPEWITDSRYGVFQRGNIWMIERAAGVPDANLTLLAVWDGEASAGEGGTAEMVQIAKSRGAQVRVIDPRKD